jgi:hypothetical protein
VPYLTRCQGPLAAVITGLLNVTPQARLSAQQVRGLLAQVAYANGGQTPAQGTSLYTPPHGTPPVRRGKRWLLVAAVVVLAAGAFAGGWFGGRMGMVEQVVDSAKGPTYSYGGEDADLPEFGLYPGQCAPARLEAGRSYGDATDCEGPHDFEVLYNLDAFGSDPQTAYPGLPALRSLAEASCALVFGLDEAVPDNLRGRMIRFSLVPTEESWTAPSSEMDRKLYCLIASRDRAQLRDPVMRQN